MNWHIETDFKLDQFQPFREKKRYSDFFKGPPPKKYFDENIMFVGSLFSMGFFFGNEHMPTQEVHVFFRFSGGSHLIVECFLVV